MKRRLKIPNVLVGSVIAAGLIALAAAMWWPLVRELTSVDPGPGRPASGDVPDLVYLADGSAWAGRVASIGGATLTLRDARDAAALFPGSRHTEPRGEMSFDLSDVVEVSLNGHYSAGMPLVPRAYFVDGSVLTARPERLARGVMTLVPRGPVMPSENADDGLIEVDIAKVTGLSFAAWRNPFRDKVDEDILVLRDGSEMTGELRGITAARVEMIAPDGTGAERVDRAKVRTVTFRRRGAQPCEPPGKSTCVVSVADGSRIKGMPVSMDDEALSLVSPVLGELSVSRDAVERIAFSNLELRDEFPVVPDKPGVKASRTPSGTILVADEDGRRVSEIDRSGKIIWEYPPRPHGGPSLPDADYEQTVIAVVSYKGIRQIEYRRCLVPPAGGGLEKPTGAVRLHNGNTLICDYGRNRVIEVSREGKIVWYAPASGAMSCLRLGRGRTLVAENHRGRVTEVRADKRVAWETGGLTNIVSAHRQRDGNTLALYGSEGLRLRKVSADGKMLWEVSGFAYPAYILASGEDRILICETRRRRLTILDNTGEKKRVLNLRLPLSVNPN